MVYEDVIMIDLNHKTHSMYLFVGSIDHQWDSMWTDPMCSNFSTNILWYQDYLNQENLKLEKWENSSTPVGKWFLVKVYPKKVYPLINYPPELFFVP